MDIHSGIVIKEMKNIMEIDSVIRVCDEAFFKPLTKRKNYQEIIYKFIKYGCFYTMFYNEDVVGYVAFYANDIEKKIAYISMIGVRNKYQRQYFGTKLMKKCCEISKEKGMEKIRLEVLKKNIKAIGFYENYGYEFEQECSDDSNYMIKDL